MSKELRRHRAETAKREKEELLVKQAEARRLGSQRLQNRSFGASGASQKTQSASESSRKSSTTSRGRSVSFADVPEESEVFEQHSDTMEQSFATVMVSFQREFV